MPLKNKVLNELELNKGTDLSGQTLAEKLGVSRNAVWKAVNALRSDGYEISSVTNKGYRLLVSSDVISSAGITACLWDKYKCLSVFSHKELDSTNNEAKRLLANGFSGTALIISEYQSGGRGRLGRAFYSPNRAGIYMTMILHPEASLSDAVSVTTAAAVAVVRAIKTLTDKTPQIKWVNDIYLDGKKICGILAEAVTSLESGAEMSVIVGIGVNFRAADFPPELAGIAGALDAEGVTRNQLVAEISNNLLKLSENLADKSYLDEYRAHSMVLGNQINYYKNGESFSAMAIGIDDGGGLIVQNEGGGIDILRSGEITVRLKTGNAGDY